MNGENRGFGFSLWFLPVVSTIFACVFGIIGYQIQKMEDETRAYAQLQNEGCHVSGTYLDNGTRLPFMVNCRGIDPLDKKMEKVAALIKKLHAPVGVDLLESSAGDEEIRTLEKIESIIALDLRDTKVTDAGMKSIGTMVNLEQLYLHNTAVSSEGLQALSGLGKLNSLYLTKTNVTSIAGLEGIASLETLCLQELPIKGEEMARVSKMSRLKDLTLRGSQVDDAGLRNLLPLRNLEELWAWTIPITDDSVETLASFKKLNALEIMGTGISANGVVRLVEQLPALERLVIGTNQVSESLTTLCQSRKITVSVTEVR